mmetsp:Transcript_9481/g.13942  ORF Transcript_9481/g.13942 Transcript_9481/m.13942 type:complete len:88 (+) Transcript_9481:179-442(+)
MMMKARGAIKGALNHVNATASIRRNFAVTPHHPHTPLKSRSHSQTIHAIGLISALTVITGVVAMAPLDELERIDQENDCYHHHLHPR